MNLLLLPELLCRHRYSWIVIALLSPFVVLLTLVRFEYLAVAEQVAEYSYLFLMVGFITLVAILVIRPNIIKGR